MNETNAVNCPVCNFNISKKVLELKTGNFDQSTLYTDIKVFTCLGCGHIFNPLSEGEREGLADYYGQEYAPVNLNSKDKVGDLPGSNNPHTINRYHKLFDFIKKHMTPDMSILDVGCSKGGFLKFLQEQGYQYLAGIDVAEDYLDKARVTLPDCSIRLGDAEKISFADDSFDFLLMDQVMEHLNDPIKAIHEAKRVLKPGGIMCLGIPDASRYDKNYFFDFYWFLLREHIQHFDAIHISLLAAQANFELIDKLEDESIMMNERMVLPNLNVIFRLSDKPVNGINQDDKFSLVKKIEKYIEDNFNKLKIRQEYFEKLAKEQRPLYVRGISREFFHLYEAAGLKKCNIKGLIDPNEYKQQHFTVDGKKIEFEEIIDRLDESADLLITAMAHIDAIKAEIQQRNSKINCLVLDK